MPGVRGFVRGSPCQGVRREADERWVLVGKRGKGAGMAGDYILAIDQGTTSSRAIVFNHDSATVGEAQQEFTQHYPRPGWVENDANEIWDVTLGVMRQALEDAGVSPGDIAAIGITNQRETVVMWDRETGEPVHNAIVWQDRRGGAGFGAVLGEGDGERGAKKRG